MSEARAGWAHHFWDILGSFESYVKQQTLPNWDMLTLSMRIDIFYYYLFTHRPGLTLPPWLECSDTNIAQCSLEPLGSGNPPATGAGYHTWFESLAAFSALYLQGLLYCRVPGRCSVHMIFVVEWMNTFWSLTPSLHHVLLLVCFPDTLLSSIHSSDCYLSNKLLYCLKKKVPLSSQYLNRKSKLLSVASRSCHPLGFSNIHFRHISQPLFLRLRAFSHFLKFPEVVRPFVEMPCSGLCLPPNITFPPLSLQIHIHPSDLVHRSLWQVLEVPKYFVLSERFSLHFKRKATNYFLYLLQDNLF